MLREHLRCFIERKHDRWAAYCVDVDLAATGATPAEVRAELDRVLERHCHDCDAGEAAAHALRRPPRVRILSYWVARLGGQASRCYLFHAPPQLLVGLA